MPRPCLVGASDLDTLYNIDRNLKVSSRYTPGYYQYVETKKVSPLCWHMVISFFSQILPFTYLRLTEIGHVVARHTAENVSSETIMFSLAVVFQSLLGLDLIFGNMISKYLLELLNSRTQEVKGDSLNQ